MLPSPSLAQKMQAHPDQSGSPARQCGWLVREPLPTSSALFESSHRNQRHVSWTVETGEDQRSGEDGSCCVPPLCFVRRDLEKREHRARWLFYPLFPGHPAQRVRPGSRDNTLLHVPVHSGRFFVKTRGYGAATARRLDQISSGHAGWQYDIFAFSSV